MAHYYRAIYADTGAEATGLLTKRKFAEGLAAGISHPGIGVGRETCIQRLARKGQKRQWVDVGLCFRKGVPVKKQGKQGSLLGTTKRRARKRR